MYNSLKHVLTGEIVRSPLLVLFLFNAPLFIQYPVNNQAIINHIGLKVEYTERGKQPGFIIKHVSMHTYKPERKIMNSIIKDRGQPHEHFQSR